MKNNLHTERRRKWEEIKKNLYECDEMEFAANRDKLFADVDSMLDELQSATSPDAIVNKEPLISIEGVLHDVETLVLTVEEAMKEIQEHWPQDTLESLINEVADIMTSLDTHENHWFELHFNYASENIIGEWGAAHIHGEHLDSAGRENYFGKTPREAVEKLLKELKK